MLRPHRSLGRSSLGECFVAPTGVSWMGKKRKIRSIGKEQVEMAGGAAGAVRSPCTEAGRLSVEMLLAWAGVRVGVFS